MKVSQTGIDLIKYFEGLRLEAYKDIAGIWTIGYGHTGPDVSAGMTISEDEAEALLRKDLTRFEQGVLSAVKVPLGQNQFDALVSLSYNIGVNAFRGSTAKRLLNKGNFIQAADAITWWNKATINGIRQKVPGLVRRRAAEAALFLTDLPTEATPDPVSEEETRVTPEENTPRRGNVLGSRTVGGAVVAGTAGAAGAGATMVNNHEGQPQASNPAENPSDPNAETGTTETNTEIGTPPADPTGPSRNDYVEAFQIGAGVLVVLAVIYILLARIDDWLSFRR
jgi:GH24 family phage-related lysozyme (muramidase)